ncbi:MULTISPECIES: hypothetical protein [Achromobacter]|uniref:Uncharacterized protein n=1 Tax=Achromobacter spanius TaxID=217203 RepID=A0ABY8GXQ6_9BURK|nr:MULTISPECIES: hypothetical protein [Achromobacter]WAI81093.1 hypothetical protein N8Z00_16210 [Achromobacter spanius]WEX96611.1 hypothetical protein N3Z32_10815 [Achromobacter sp. SS2-2022]WFP09673.1 hypothetical protein P8T11_07295 [Achromobacter spanius]
MNDKTKIWKSSTTTRSWSSTTDLTPEQRVNIEDLLDGKLGSVSIQEKWSYAGTENGEAFKVDIDNGAVTVNGRHYDSLDDVPRAERERIEALRDGEGMKGLWDMLKNAGVQIEDMPGDDAARTGKPAFTIETDDGSADAIASASARPLEATETARVSTDPTASPGAVPKSGGLRRALLIGIAVGLALWVGRALNLF